MKDLGQCLVLQKTLKMWSALFCNKKFRPIYTRHLYYNVPTQKVGMLVPLQQPSTKAHLRHLLAHRSAIHELGSPEHKASLFLRVQAKLSRLQGHPIHALKINKPSISSHKACSRNTRSCVCIDHRDSPALLLQLWSFLGTSVLIPTTNPK